MKIRFSTLLLVVISCGIISGCSKRFNDLPAFSAIPIYDAYNHSVGRFKTSYLADQIHAYYRGHTNGPIGVTTFVDLDDLYGSSSFGRFVGEQLMTELAMRGYNVIELRKTDMVQILSNEREFSLSRDVGALRDFQNLSGIVVGTYVASPIRVYLNARLIDPKSAIVVSAGSVEMAKTDEIARLLRANSLPTTLERIPVRNLGYTSNLMPFYPPWAAQGFYPYGMHSDRFEREEEPMANPGMDQKMMAPKPSLGPTT
ncbi:MAG: hypothetical protein KDD44_03235 [Bdellovibrionales bacterium]|nr:hypothetical protein [Bdellovibrionales bacterium]